MDELERSAQLLRETLEELRRTGMITAQTFAKLNQATAAATGAQNTQTQAINSTNQGFKKLYDTTKQVASGFLETAQQARKNREDFTSLNPAIRATGTMFGKGAKTVGSAASAFGDALMGVSLFLPGWGKAIGLGFAALFKGGGAVAQVIGEEAGKAVAAYGEFITSELQRVVQSFRTIASVGALGADGMRGFIDDANRSGLAYEQFASVFAKNSENLSRFSGTALAGRKALAGVSAAAKPFEEQFLALGIGFEEQRDMFAKSMNQSRILNNVARNDSVAQAQAAKDYIFQLKELTALTGLSNDQAEAVLERQRSDVRFQAIMQQFGNTVDAGGKNMATGFQRIGSILTTEVGPVVGTGFQDAISNLGTDAAQSFMLATGGAGKQIIEDYRANRITQEQALFQIDAAIRKRFATMGGVATQAALGKLGTRFENIFPEMFKLQTRQDNLSTSLEQAKDAVDGSAAATDAETKDIVRAQKQLQNFAQQLDLLVSKKIIPNAASHVEIFTRALSGSIDMLNQKLGIDTGAPRPGLTGPEPAFAREQREQRQRRGSANGAAGQAPERTAAGASADYLSRIQQLESGGRNIANVPRAGQTATSAHGLYQITQKTFESLVANAAPGSALRGKTFEDMKTDVNLQTEAMQQLTSSNEQLLARRGLSTSDAAKYMAHMMGYGTAAKILEAPGSMPLNRLMPQDYLDKNGLGMMKNAGELRSHFDRITGGAGYQYGGVASGPRSGYTAMLHGTEAVVPLPDGRSIPVEMTGMTDKMGEQISMMGQQISSLNEMVSLMRTNNDINTRILRYSAC